MARDRTTGACDLDMELLLSSGALDAQPKRSLWRGLLAWLLGPAPF